MENARSYGSRFSGLGLFLLALLVVGVLVFLTIRSARDDNTQVVVESGTVQTEDSDFTITSSSTDGSSANVAADTTVVADTSGDGVVEDDSLTASTEAVTDVADLNLPNTGPESVVVSLFVLSALGASYVSFRQSRQLLNKANKQSY